MSFRNSLLLVALLTACTGAARYVLNEEVSEPGLIKFTATELNDKYQRKKYDMLVYVENLSDKSILMYLGEMKCFKGQTRGDLGHAFFGAGERTIDFKPGQIKKFRFVCNFQEVIPDGNFVITIGRVFSNPSEDGKTAGDELAKSFKIEIVNDGRGKEGRA